MESEWLSSLPEEQKAELLREARAMTSGSEEADDIAFIMAALRNQEERHMYLSNPEALEVKHKVPAQHPGMVKDADHYL